MRPFVEDRFAGWVQSGANEKELETILGRIHDPRGTGPGSWVHEFAQTAFHHERFAQKAEAQKDQAKAVHEYKLAAVYYYLARFPHLLSPGKEEAYKKHIECYLKSTKTADPPLEIVRIPYEGKHIVGYLRIPPGRKRPAVLFTGGVDTWKSDFDNVIKALLAEGLAVFAVDIPGTGQSAWKLAPENTKVLSRALQYLKTRSEIDGSRIGVFMISFGGYFAVRLALTDPNVKAAVNVGGPVAMSFTRDNIKLVPQVMIATIAHAMEISPKMPINELVAAVKTFSLADLLSSARHRAFLLSINGDKDKLVPIEDLYVISKSGVKQDEWVFKGAGHCAMGNMKEWAPKAAKWLKQKLM
jgi:pimeloyl-ACP methyl ester carboxylesterase